MDDSSLKALHFVTRSGSALTLHPPFDRTIRKYVLTNLSSEVDAVVVTASPTEPDAFVQVLKSQSNGQVNIPVGSTDVEVRCEASDGSVSVTVVHVTRPSPSDATLGSFKSSTGVLFPDFHRLELDYVLRVGATTDRVVFQPSATDPKATVSMSKTSLDAIGCEDTDITCTVRSANGSATTTYTVCVRKVKNAFGLEQSCRPLGIFFKTQPLFPSNTLSCNHAFCEQCFSLFPQLAPTPPKPNASNTCPICRAGGGECEAPLDDGGGTRREAPPSNKLASTSEQPPFHGITTRCPFSCPETSGATIPLQSLASHVANDCKAFASLAKALRGHTGCSACAGSAWASAAVISGGGSGPGIACVAPCAACGRAVRADRMEAHQAHWCLAARDGGGEEKNTEVPSAASGTVSRMKPWEKTFLSKSKAAGEGCTNGSYSVDACASAAEEKKRTYVAMLDRWRSGTYKLGPDAVDILKECASWVSAGMTATEEKIGGVVGANLHAMMGWLVEEIDMVEDLLGKEEKISAGAVGREEENAAAADGFMSDEVDGLLLGLGVPPSASDAAKLTAMDKEYHRLLGLGHNDQAAEVQGLYSWKAKQAASKTKTETESVDIGTFESTRNSSVDLAMSKYEQALNVERESGEVHFHLGSASRAVPHLKKALGLKPLLPNGELFLAVALVLSTDDPKEAALNDLVVALKEAKLMRSVQQWAKIASFDFRCSSGLTLVDDIHNPIHPLYCLLPLALAAGHILQGSTKAAIGSLQSQLADIPTHGNAGFSLFETRRIIGQLLMDRPQPHLLESIDAFNCNSIVPASRALLADGLQKHSALLTLLEKIAETAAFRRPCRPLPLAWVGRAKLELAELDVKDNLGKVDESIVCFEAALSVEESSDMRIALDRLRGSCEWFVKLEREASQRDKWIGAALAGTAGSSKKEVKKAAGGGAVAKKPGVGPVAQPGKRPNVADKKPGANPKGQALPGITGGATKKPNPGQPVGGPTAKANAPKANGNVGFGTQATHQPKTGPVTVSAHAETSPVTTIAPLAPPPSLNLSRVFEARIGLARALTRRLNSNPATEGDQIQRIEGLYRSAIEINPTSHDAHIELGYLLERRVSPAAARAVYAGFPFQEMGDATPQEDDLFLYSEAARLLMKEKRYQDPVLEKALIAEGRAMGMATLEKYVAALDAASEYKLLMRVYAGVNKKAVDDPDLVPFFKAKFWM
ncbi:hypothetical protein DFJ73DRAFT_767307 [Zopfochytrium polystomum]|nr:hypothetical protein DFJ73DRAFT_767307 [Zopfochytrium polystomum]